MLSAVQILAPTATHCLQCTIVDYVSRYTNVSKCNFDILGVQHVYRKAANESGSTKALRAGLSCKL